MNCQNWIERRNKDEVQDLIDAGILKYLIRRGSKSRNHRSYCCDLLSLAMGNMPAGSAWVTVMGNVNTLAVASLADAACIILAQGSTLDENALEKAKEQKITVLQTQMPIFDAALTVYRYLHA